MFFNQLTKKYTIKSAHLWVFIRLLPETKHLYVYELFCDTFLVFLCVFLGNNCEIECTTSVHCLDVSHVKHFCLFFCVSRMFWEKKKCSLLIFVWKIKYNVRKQREAIRKSYNNNEKSKFCFETFREDNAVKNKKKTVALVNTQSVSQKHISALL